MRKIYLTCLCSIICVFQNVGVQAQGLNPLTGAWKKSNGYFFNWINEDTGIFDHVQIQFAEDGKTVSKVLEGWVTQPNEAGLSHRFIVSSSGNYAMAYQTFDGKEIRIHWVAQGKAGHEKLELSADGTTITANGSFDLNDEGFSMRDLGDSAVSTKLPESHERGWKNFRELLQKEAFVMPAEEESQLFDSRLTPLLGRWHSNREDGSLALEINWRQTALGKFLLEVYKFYDTEGNISASGLNISGNDPYSDRILLWGNNAEAFHQKGGWDFVDDKTIIQREGDWRLIRKLENPRTIDARWEQKIAGRYRKAKDSSPYTLRKLYNNDEAKSEIENFLASFISDFTEGDLKSLMSHYHKDAVKLTSLSVDPLIGKKAIAADFSPRIGNAQLKASLSHASALTPDHLLGCGDFQIVGPGGETMAQGQWGNVFVIEQGRCLMLQESVHVLNLEGISDASNNNYQDIRRDQPQMAHTKEYLASEKMVKDYLAAWSSRDADQVTNIFDDSGIRVVSAVEGVTQHHRDIKESVLKDLEVNSSQTGQEAILDATTLGATAIGGNTVLAYGKWQIRQNSGKVIQTGTWGNVMRQRGDEVKIILEAAGTYSPN